MAKLCSILLLFLLLSAPLPGQDSTLDSLQQILKESKETEAQIKANLQIGQHYTVLRLDTAAHIINRAISLSASSSNNHLLAKSYLHMATFFNLVNEDREKAYYFACKARDLAIVTRDSSNVITRYTATADLYGGSFQFSSGNYSEAQQLFLNARQGFERVYDLKSVLKVNNQLMILYGEQDMLDEAQKVLDESIQISQQNKWYYDLMTFQSNKGALLYYRGMNTESIQSYKKAESLIYDHLDTTDYYSLGLIFTNIGSNYHDLNTFDSSFIYYQKGLDFRKKTDNLPSIVSSYSYLATVCIALEEFQQAKTYCTLMQEGLDSTQDKALSIKGITTWMNYYEAAGDYQSAFEKGKAYNQLREELINEENIRQQTAQQKEFEFQKERSINEKELALKNEKITLQKSHSEKITLWLIVVSVLLLAFIILLYTNFKKRQIITSQNEKLNQSVSEKEVLLKEIHHRVKNNLQLVSSLIGLQSESTDNELVKDVFEEGQNRVQAMALIHQKLYQKEVSSEIDFSDYLRELAKHYDQMNTTDQKVKIEINCEDVQLDIDTAIPLGLIINELFTNAFKHAFKNIDNPKMEVSIKATENKGEYLMRLSDNGVGLPSDLDWKKVKSLGLRLVRNLVKQLLGNINYEYQQDFSVFSIRFKNQFGRNLIE